MSSPRQLYLSRRLTATLIHLSFVITPVLHLLQSEDNIMAKRSSNAGRGRGSKSEAIREYLKTNRTAKPKEVVAALKVQGVDVGTNLVSITKARMKIRKAKRRAKKATAAGSNTAAALTGNATGL